MRSDALSLGAVMRSENQAQGMAIYSPRINMDLQGSLEFCGAGGGPWSETPSCHRPPVPELPGWVLAHTAFQINPNPHGHHSTPRPESQCCGELRQAPGCVWGAVLWLNQGASTRPPEMWRYELQMCNHKSTGLQEAQRPLLLGWMEGTSPGASPIYTEAQGHSNPKWPMLLTINE